jgi:hypothetical protein
MSICSEQCPFFSPGARNKESSILYGYGCQKYAVATHCIISAVQNVSSTQYELFVEDTGKQNGLQKNWIALAITSLGQPHEWEKEAIEEAKKLQNNER